MYSARFISVCFLVVALLAGCARKPVQVAFPQTGLWKEVNPLNVPELSCPGKILPTRYRLMEANYPELRKLLLKKGSQPGALNLDTTLLMVPLPNGTSEEFRITQVQVLPPELADKYPDIKTYHGNSIPFPEDIIRLDISPKGINMMILSTRGTIMVEPFCSTDSVHVISYFKKDLPDGGKEEFEK